MSPQARVGLTRETLGQRNIDQTRRNERISKCLTLRRYKWFAGDRKICDPIGRIRLYLKEGVIEMVEFSGR